MGQRLIMTIKEDDKDLMKVYYHWSAYTISSLVEAQQFIDSYYEDELEEVEDTKLRCIRALEKIGARLENETELEEFKKLYPNEKIINDSINRNKGLIAITEQGMKDLQEYSEGDIIINLSAATVCCDCVSIYEDLEEYNEWNEEDLKEEDLDHLDIDLENIDFPEIENTILTLDHVNDYIFINGIDECKEVVSIVA